MADEDAEPQGKEEDPAAPAVDPSRDAEKAGVSGAAGTTPTLATPRKKGAKKKTPTASQASGLEGRWHCDDGAPVEITGTKLRFVDTGGTGQLTRSADGSVYLLFKGKSHHATLAGDGSLCWSDGDVWRQSEAAATPNAAGPATDAPGPGSAADALKPDEPAEPAAPESTRQRSAKASSLAGRWRGDDGALIEVTGTKLRFVDTGGTGQLTRTADGSAHLLFKGKSHHATLSDDGSLLWSDGDVWCRNEDPAGEDLAGGPAGDAVVPAVADEAVLDEAAAAGGPGRKAKVVKGGGGKAATAKVRAEARRLEGSWSADDGTPVEVAGTTLRFVDTGGTGQLTQTADGGVHLLFKGKSYQATLERDGSLLWSDGDVWRRAEVGSPADACNPAPPTPSRKKKTKTEGAKSLVPVAPEAQDAAGPCARLVRAESSQSWYEDALAVEDVAPPDPACVSEAEEAGDEPEIIADLKPHTAEVRANPALQSLLRQAKELSEDCFYEDCTEGCSKRGGWRLTLLASGMEEGSGATLLGFLVFRLKPDLSMPVLSVSKLAVPEAFRRRGYGRKLTIWATQYAKTLPMIQCIGLSSLPDAVTFYQHLGFRRMHVIKAKEDVAEQDDDLIPGQVYMEFKIKRPGGGRRR